MGRLVRTSRLCGLVLDRFSALFVGLLRGLSLGHFLAQSLCRLSSLPAVPPGLLVGWSSFVWLLCDMNWACSAYWMIGFFACLLASLVPCPQSSGCHLLGVCLISWLGQSGCLRWLVAHGHYFIS